MLGQRRRRWPSIEPTLVQCHVFTGFLRVTPKYYMCLHNMTMHDYIQ